MKMRRPKLPHQIMILTRTLEKWRRAHNTSVSSLSKHWPSSPNTSDSTSHSTHACQRFSNVHEALRLPRGWKKNIQCRAPATPNKVLTCSDPPNMSHLLRLPRKNHIHTSSSKNGARKREPTSGREVPGDRFCARLPQKTETRGFFTL